LDPPPKHTQELGALLGVTPERAEQVAADMLQEGRLQGSIDQVGGRQSIWWCYFGGVCVFLGCTPKHAASQSTSARRSM
jgi:hypothetical protein